MHKQRYARVAMAAVLWVAGSTAYGFRSEEALQGRAAGPVAPAPVASAAMQERAKAAGAMNDLVVEWDVARGTPSLVTSANLAAGGRAQGVKGLRFSGQGDLAQDSIAVMDALSRVYGIRDAASEFKPMSIQTSASGYRHVRMRQQYLGLPVVGAELIVHYDAKGTPRTVNGTYYPDLKVAAKPTLTAGDALAVARQDQQALGKPQGQVTAGPDLVVLVRGGITSLAYQLVLVYDDGQGGVGRWRYWIDALAGAVLWRYNDIPAIAAPTGAGAHTALTGALLDGEGGATVSVTGWRENAGPYYYLWNKTNTWYIFNNGRGPDANTYAYRTTSDWGTSDRVEVSAGFDFDAIQTYWRTVHGRRSFDNANAMARANVHYGNSYVNAYWNGADFTFGDGDGYYASELGVMDVAGHEFTHAVTEYTAGLIYQDESGALNESWSDIFGTLIEFGTQPDGRSAYPNRVPGAADWLLGEDCWLSSTALRDMRNPANPATVGAGNEQPTRYKGTFWYTGAGDNGGVHQNSGVQNFFFYLLCEGGAGINDGLSYAVIGAGIPAGEKLAYLTLTQYTGAGTDYPAERAAWIAAAVEMDGSGKTTNTVLSVMQAWAAVGIGTSELVMPAEPYIVSGVTNSPPYLPSNKVYFVVNPSATDVVWTVSHSATWLTVTPSTLTVSPGTYSNVVVAVDQAAAAALPEGIYGDTLTFSNPTTNLLRQAALRLGQNYRMQSYPYSWIDPRSPPGYSLLDLSAGVSGAYPLPFPFRLYGTLYTNAYVSAFGMVGFVNQGLTSGNNADLPTASAPRGMLCPYWDAIDSRRTPSLVFAGVLGSTPNRQAVFTWQDASHASDTSLRLSFQVILKEAALEGDNNDIIFQYRNAGENNTTVGSGQSATIGIEDELGALNKKYSYNGSTWVSDNQAILFTQLPVANTNTPVGTIRALGAVGSTVSFEIRFSEVVTGFDLSDLVLGGTAGGAVGSLSGSGMRYLVDVTNVANYGSVTLAVLGGAVSNDVGNANAPFGPAIYVMPYSGIDMTDDMEAGPGEWVASGQQPVQVVTAGWEWGVPTYEFGPTDTPSGTKCWGTVLGGVYSNNMNAWVESVPIAVGGNPIVEFKTWYDLEAIMDIYFYDFGYVEVNNGSGWVNVTPNGYFGGYSGGWLTQQIPLDNAQFGNRTIKVRFRATSDGSVTRAGMYVDDLVVSSQRPAGISVIAYSPTHGAADSTVPLTVTVYNSSTQTIDGVSGMVSSPNAGVSVTGSATVAYGNMVPGAVVVGAPVSLLLGAAGNFDASTIQIFHSLTANGGYTAQDILPFIVDGVVVSPATNFITVRASVGVTNWLGKALKGDGTVASCLFQVIGAGANGLIDPPGPGGAVTGDDKLLFSSAGGLPYGRFGEGAGIAADFGRFIKTFTHSLPGGQFVYIRAWDSASFDGAVAYGDSATYALKAVASQTNDFRTWCVGTPWNAGRDSNGDSIPDGYSILNGMDPRSPMLPLDPGWSTAYTVGASGTGAGQFKTPAPTRLFYRGSFLYVLDTGNNRVQVWNRDTRTYVGSYGSAGTNSGSFSQPLGLAIDPRTTTNRFAVADTQNHRIQVFGFNPVSGGGIAFQFQFGSVGSGNAQFRNPNSVAFGPDGRLFVADTGNGADAGNSRIQMFSETGAYLGTIASAGTNAAQVNMPRGVCVATNGAVIVADTGNHRIQAFDQAGNPLWSVGSHGTNALQFAAPRGVQVGVGGRVYVSDTDNSRIQVLDAAGGHITTLGTHGFSFSQVLNHPYDLMPVLDASVVYVADTLNNRVHAISTVFDHDGDGMDDVWEDLHGLNSSDPTDWQYDYNGNGTINIGEYRLQQSPGYPIRITAFTAMPAMVQWETALSGGIYQLEYATGDAGLTLPNWQPGPVVTSFVMGASSWTNAVAPTNALQFLRIRHLNP